MFEYIFLSKYITQNLNYLKLIFTKNFKFNIELIKLNDYSKLKTYKIIKTKYQLLMN